MTPYSQRDNKWKDDKMGSGTLGNFGCAVTCISMMSEITPAVMNNEIKSVGGYQDNMLIWEKLDLIKGLDFIKRVRAYENTEVANNLPCLVEVNGAPIGGTTHWVLYIGNQRCWDPWDGKEKPIGYSVIKWKAPAVEPLPCVITDQTKIPQLDGQEVQAVKSSIIAKDTEITNLKLSVTALNASITDLQYKLDHLPPNSSQALFIALHDVIWGKGWVWDRMNKLKVLLPR
jgi:copper chaperone CopZ